MKKTKQPFYISYTHLIYICFALVFLQIILLISMQSNTRTLEASDFIHSNNQLVSAFQDELSALNLSDMSREMFLIKLRKEILPHINDFAKSLDSYVSWQSEQLVPDKNNQQSADFEITSALHNPYLLRINLPNQKLSILISCHLSPDSFWLSVISSIFLLIFFLIICAIFIHISNFNLKYRLSKGLNQRQSNEVIKPDLTDDLIREAQMIMDQKTLMLSALSHDLKTPLTELELKLHLLEDEKLSQSLLKRTHEISQISNTSLQYAKGFNHLEKDEYDLVELLTELAQKAHTPKKHVIFETNLIECFYFIEYYLFKRMITNLIHNAKKYANHCHIKLIKTYEAKIIISISDDGPGVQKDDLKNLGKPFYRAINDGNKHIQGTGLGLSIVKHIAQIHYLEVEFQQSAPSGLKVILSEI